MFPSCLDCELLEWRNVDYSNCLILGILEDWCIEVFSIRKVRQKKQTVKILCNRIIFPSLLYNIILWTLRFILGFTQDGNHLHYEVKVSTVNFKLKVFTSTSDASVVLDRWIAKPIMFNRCGCKHLKAQSQHFQPDAGVNTNIQVLTDCRTKVYIWTVLRISHIMAHTKKEKQMDATVMW